jgi:LmbE family N-acetylglucosaminyl deacetylase
MNTGAKEIRSLLGRVLVLVAHQDDETACAIVLQRAREAQVVFATDGAPASEFFWAPYGSRERYAAIRRAEAIESLAVVGASAPVFLEDPVRHTPFRDQELYRFIPSALEALGAVVRRFEPDALLVPAYEGGHPDHDVCNFLACVVAQMFSIPVWEMPLYHRSASGALVYQEFRVHLEGSVLLHPFLSELRRRDDMLSKYVSQPELRNFVSARVERIRPLANYDYSQAPHPGLLNYEAWGWAMTGTELCEAFQSCVFKSTEAAIQ